jgi:methionyl-tRNA synthetase
MTDPNLSNLQEEIKTIIGRIPRPEKVMVTGGMPYANGQLHLGHLAGAHIPSDIYARFNRMFIGSENVLFVCGTDDHGSTSELSAKKAGKDIREFIGGIHQDQRKTLCNYNISLDTYTGTSREETFETHKNYCQDFLRKLHANKMLDTRTSEQWFDTKEGIFLPDRLITGTCPKCEDTGAYSEECDACGATYEPKDLKDPISSVTGTTPELRPTDHWFLNMWKVTDELNTWLEGRKKTWRKFALAEAQGTVAPSIQFSQDLEDKYKEIKAELPKHKSRYSTGRQIVAQFSNLADLETAKNLLAKNSIEAKNYDSWAFRAITRDVKWGIPLPEEIDSKMKGKTFYVWPESLVAPISFSQTALKERSNQTYKDYWCNPNAKIAQFIGIDNVFFYSVMQGALWFGTQKEPNRMPVEGELQLSDIYPVYHLQINGKKMSKSTGNFYTADQLINEMGYTPDQVRYFLSILSLHKAQSNFDLKNFDERNSFLAGPLNAAFEKPISAANKKFNGVVPDGKLVGKTVQETKKIIQAYMNNMNKAQYSDLLYLLENYARLINKIFTNFKPHDDRHDEQERIDGLYSSFFILKNLMIMLHPFVPATVEKLRISLNLPESVFNIEELGKPIPAGHKVGELQEFFPAVELDNE